MSAEVYMAIGYALFLVGVALGIDLLARHSQRRSERYRTAGFTFHQHLDAWECPEGEHLRRAEVDHERRLVRYRARAHVCNACPAKPDCTDSYDGREVVRPIDPWPHSDVGRFHRAFAAALTTLALFVLCVEAFRHHAAGELLILLPVLAGVVPLLAWLIRDLRATPSTFEAVAGGSAGRVSRAVDG